MPCNFQINRYKQSEQTICRGHDDGPQIATNAIQDHLNEIVNKLLEINTVLKPRNELKINHDTHQRSDFNMREIFLPSFVIKNSCQVKAILQFCLNSDASRHARTEMR